MCSRGRDLGGKRFVCNSQCMNYHPARIAPNFIVPDVVATAKYYCDVLGFTSVRYDGEPPVFALVE